MGKKDFDNFVIDDIDYFEYDCFDYCTPDGCKGHVTDIPISFCFNGIQFFVEGFEGGTFPGRDESHIMYMIVYFLVDLMDALVMNLIFL